VTRDEFIAAVKALGKSWFFEARGGPARIRTTVNGVVTCPVCAVGNEPGIWAASVGAQLGLPSGVLGDIVYAADGRADCDKKLRAELVQACGLRESR
jgi:hypothetical protein